MLVCLLIDLILGLFHSNLTRETRGLALALTTYSLIGFNPNTDRFFHWSQMMFVKTEKYWFLNLHPVILVDLFCRRFLRYKFVFQIYISSYNLMILSDI